MYHPVFCVKSPRDINNFVFVTAQSVFNCAHFGRLFLKSSAQDKSGIGMVPSEDVSESFERTQVALGLPSIRSEACTT